jgi:hypothetical protein
MPAARGWVSYSPRTSRLAAGGGLEPDDAGRPELADVARLGRRLVRHAVQLARADESSVRHLLTSHFGADVPDLPVVSAWWPPYDHVNVQAGLEAWLATPGREHEIAGLTGFRHTDFGLSDLVQPSPWQHVGLGSVTTTTLPSGPDGATRACVQCAIYLVRAEAGPLALLLRGPEEHGTEQVTVEVACASQEQGRRALDEIRQLAIEHNVFRGHVIAFGGEVFGHGGSALLSFTGRPQVRRDQVILPADVLDGIERQVLGVARHSGRLLASGQHLKRGVLLHGAPGTGKTHTIRYLLSELAGVTVVVLSGGALRMIAEACSVARTLQPSLIVVEDVDLIAEEREFGMGQHPLLFQLLNEMDGLGEDLDVTFLLTTNRADLLEPALAQRPGRVDHAALLPLPDAEARQRLLHLYRGNLVLELAGPDTVITRTEGVTASFMKELLRRAALRAAEEDGGAGAGPAAGGRPLRVTDTHLNAALDQLLDTRNELTRVLLGGRPASAGPPGGTH